MARQLVSPLMEILAKDINAFRKTADKTLLDVFLGNSLPRLPAFIGGSFRATISGANIDVENGICFQEIPQTDGSSNLRIAHLEDDQTLTINLPPNAGTTKKDLIECRSIIEDLPEESRKFNEVAGVTSKNTVVQNKWSAEVRVRENVVANATGGYDAAEGWVAVALVNSNNVGIVSIEDQRNFYNLFDPDFFSRYGRKNISFSRRWDGILLVEVPFEFSDLVSKASQISVRRMTEETYGETTSNTVIRTGAMRLTAPTSGRSQRSLRPASQRLFQGRRTNLFRATARWNDQLSPTTSEIGYTDPYPSRSGRNWTDDLNYAPAYFRFFLGTPGSEAVQGGTPHNSISQFSLSTFSQSLLNALTAAGIYILFSNSSAPSLTNCIIWQLMKSVLTYPRPRGRSTNRQLFFAGLNDSVDNPNGNSPSPPIHRAINAALASHYIQVMTVNPILNTVIGGSTKYNLSGAVNITDFFQLKSLEYDISTNTIKFVLRDTSAGATVFPAEGRVFNEVSIRAGSVNKWSRLIGDFASGRGSVSIAGVEATYTYPMNQTEAATFERDLASQISNLSIRFSVSDQVSTPIRRANILRPTTDYTVIEEGLKTYVRFSDSLDVENNDDMIFSHIIPQELVDVGSGGTPEEQTAAVQIEALKQQLNALTAKVNINEADIDTLENQAALADVIFFYGVLSAGAKNSATRTNFRSNAHTSPLVAAALANPANRTSRTVSSLLTVGARIDFNSGVVAGYYAPWIAIKQEDLTANASLLILGVQGDESRFWTQVGTTDVGGDTYNLYLRTSLLSEGKSLVVSIKEYS